MDLLDFAFSQIQVEYRTLQSVHLSPNSEYGKTTSRAGLRIEKYFLHHRS